MTSIGFDKPLYLLPFDHRGTLQARLFGWKGELTTEQAAQISATKQVIYDGFTSAIASGVPKDKAAILVDEQFGASILRDATDHGYLTVCPAEKYGQEEFEFEFGEEFGEHIEACNPSFCKVLVRYNPEDDKDLKVRQCDRLARLSDYLHCNNRSHFMFELRVPPVKAQLDQFNGSHRAYELKLRPQLAVQAIEELQTAGIEPDLWNLEGLDRREDCEKIVRVARRHWRGKVGCIMLGHSEDELRVRQMLKTAATVPGFIGFAVGQTCFFEPLLAWRYGTITRDGAATVIARRYMRFVDIFEHTAIAA